MLSLIIPVQNEAEHLFSLHREIVQTLSRLHQAAEILYVDDASTDDTPAVINALAADDPRVKGLRLTRNSDKGGALLVGFCEAAGEVCVTLDGDLQNDPADLPLLLAALDRADVILGWRKERRDPFRKRWASWIFNACMNSVFRTSLHDANTGYKVLRRETALSVPLANGLFRFSSFILSRRGLRVLEVPVHHRPRENGSSRFGVGRIRSLLRLPQALRAAYGRQREHDALPAYERLERPGMIRA